MSRPAKLLPPVRRDKDGLIRCRVCRCTETDACNPPCGWAPDDFDLCDNCAHIIGELVSWLESARTPGWPALRREAEATLKMRFGNVSQRDLKRKRADERRKAAR